MKNGPRRKKARRAALPVAAGLTFLFLPAVSAQAHTTVPGLGEFASGFLHPLLTPPHLLVLVALGLWLGQRVPLTLKWPSAIFAASAALGLVSTLTGAIHGVYQPILIAIGLGIAGGVVFAAPAPLSVRLAACAVVALALGLDSGTDPGIAGMAVAKTLFATWVSLLLCVVNLAFYVSLLPPVKWAQTGVRVVGSWIVAIALLMLAFSLRR